MSDQVLLTVSGTIPSDLDAQIGDGDRPRPDYHAMAEAMGADLIDHPRARALTGRVGQVVEKVLGSNAMLALACFRARRRYRLVFTDGEQVGLPLAALRRLLGRRGARHFMIVHILSVRKKRLLFRSLRLGPLIDRMFVYASRQRDLIVAELGYPADRITVTPFTVDAAFWDPARVTPTPRPRMICSAGLELRDYPTLIEAMRGTDIEAVLAAASPWSKRSDTTRDVDVPANVTLERFGFVALRDLYASAAAVVVPLEETDFQAGITTILEAMAMAKPVVCTRTRGQTDTIIDGVTGRYVEPGDVAGLRSAILDVLADPETAARLGAAARAWVLEHADVGVYARRLAEGVASAD